MPPKLIVDRISHLRNLIVKIKQETNSDDDDSLSALESEDENIQGGSKRRRRTRDKRSKRQKQSEGEEISEEGSGGDKSTRLLRCSFDEILDFYTRNKW